MMRVVIPVCLVCCTPANGAPVSRLWLSVSVNGTPSPVLMPVSQAGSALLMSAGALRTLRLPVDEGVPDAAEVSLQTLPGLLWHYSEPAQALALTFPPGQLRSLNISSTPVSAPVITPAGLPAQILDYSVRHTWQPGYQQLSGSGVFRMTGQPGSLSNSFLFNDHPVWQGEPLVRLDTAWQTTDVDRARQFTLGDAVSQSPAWGTGLRMAGVQWGSLMTLRSDIVTTALPQFSGLATLPSTLDVYVNRQKVMTRQVPSGPFEVEMQPGVSGSEVTLVTRDATGAQQVTTQAWYYTPDLLTPGLNEFSAEAGIPRTGYGLRSAQYDRGLLFAAGTLRHGLNRKTTLNTCAQVMADGLWLAGGGIARATGSRGVFSLDGAVSRWRNLTGAVVSAGLEGRPAGALTVSVSMMQTAGVFTDVSRVATVSALQRRGQSTLTGTGALAEQVLRAGAYVPLWSGGPAAGLNWSRLRQQEETREQISASLSGGLTSRTGYYLSVYEDLHRQDKGVFLSFRYTPDGGVSAVTDLSRENGTVGGIQTLSGQADPTTGQPGWDMSLSRNGQADPQTQGGLQWRTAPALLTARAGSGPRSWTSLSASGTLVMAQGDVFAASDSQDSYAIVTHAGPHGRILRGGVVAGEAGQEGRFLVTGLRPGQIQSLYLDTRTLPADWVAATTEQQVVAPWRGITRVDFGARQVRAVTLQLRDGQRRPLPPGYPVNLNGRPATVTGYDGEVWLEEMAEKNVIQVDYPDGTTCTAYYNPPAVAAGINGKGQAECVR